MRWGRVGEKVGRFMRGGGGVWSGEWGVFWGRGGKLVVE